MFLTTAGFLVLNLIITGIPSILYEGNKIANAMKGVLNLIITGIPSIPAINVMIPLEFLESFKPYYNWNTFNTLEVYMGDDSND